MNQIEVMAGVVITNQRCAVIKARGVVVLSDLHVGYESVLEDSGLHLPRIQTQSMCDSIQRIIELYGPDRFVVLGDADRGADGFAHPDGRTATLERAALRGTVRRNRTAG